MRKVSFYLMLALLVLGLVQTGVGAKEEVIRFAADCAFPPFEYVDAAGKLAGFDVDLAYAIGKELGIKVEFINTGWDGLIPGLMNNNFDVIASGMTITAERQMSVNFSDPYFEAKQVILVPVKEKTIQGPADLKGKVVTVQIGTTGDFQASELKGLKKVARFNFVPEAIQEVLNENAVACIVDNFVAMQYIKEYPGTVKIVEGDYFAPEYYGLALRKKDTELLKKVNQALAALKANGTYEQISNKYF